MRKSFFSANLPKGTVQQDFNYVFLGDRIGLGICAGELLVVFKTFQCSSDLYLNLAFLKRLRENNSEIYLLIYSS
jgi:hypothetical protein